MYARRKRSIPAVGEISCRLVQKAELRDGCEERMQP